MNLFSRRKAGKCGAAILTVLLLAFSLGGCQTMTPAKTPLEMMTTDPEPRMTLGPGDVLDVKFYYAPELNESQTVRPDGMISLQLIGDVDVRGKTPAELRKELMASYANQLKKPEVTVIVRSLTDRKIYVGGEVKRPGQIPLPGRMTALEAIMQAGGFDRKIAEVSNVIVIRHKDGKRYGCSLDMRGDLEGVEGKSFYLEPQDIVYVPRTTIAKVNLWIDQYVNKLIPRAGFTFSTPVGTSTIGIDTSVAVAVP